MRKVTASAVILTALTGCSQSSGIPSAQWSFELPSGDKAQAKGTDTDSSTSAELSADAESFLGGTFSKNKMGPAFEQPAASGLTGNNAPAGSRLSSIGRPGSQEISRIALETAAITSNTSSRPDPVDQVRSYLRSSGRPSALANRTPYASQVYLSAVPTSNPGNISNFPVALSGNVPSPNVALATVPSTVPSIALASSAGSALTANAETNSVTTSTGFSQPELNRDYSADFGFVDTQAAYGDIALPSSTSEATVASSAIAPAAPATEETPVFTGTIAADGLPQLAPAQPSDLAFLNQASQVAPPIEEENLSIGTAILRDLQRSSQEAAFVETASASRAVPVEGEVTALETETTFDSNGDSSVSLVPSSANGTPTLAGLRQTMPRREPSPLVIARQTSADSDFQLAFPGRAAADGPELEALNIEGSSVLEAQTSSPATNANFERAPLIPSTTIEADLHSSNDSYSPLLAGFNTTESASTIYVPIADEASSSDLIQNAVMALGQEASTAALLEDIAFKNAFSSVLASAALMSGESTPAPSELVAQSPLDIQSLQTGAIEITTEEASSSEAIKAFSVDANRSRLSILQQGVLKQSEGKRRQLITWR